MATSGGPNIINDGMVFGYDTGYPMVNNDNSYRFNKGEPTTNLITNPIPETDTTGFNRSGGTGTISYDSTEKALKWVQTDYASWGTYLNIYPSFTGTLSTSTQYTLSFEYKTQNPFSDSLIGHQLVQGNGQSSAASTGGISNNTDGEINGWKQFKVTFTPGNSGVGSAYNRLYCSDRGSDTLTIYIRNIQFENKSHKTPFVDGTRDADTQSLKDLKETAAIDVEDVSFDSNAQMIFDGTDDKINLGASSQFNIQRVVTIESVVKRDSSNWNGIFGTTTGGSFIHWQLSSSGLNCYFYGPGLAITKSNEVTDTSKFYHLVVTFDGTTARLYNNGEQVNTATTTSTANITSTSATSIGQVYSTDRMFDGNIPIVKIYNRALSANEIKQNYNSYKNRFGI